VGRENGRLCPKTRRHLNQVYTVSQLKRGSVRKQKVSIMVDIQTVSIAIASASVVAGIVYYAFQVRHQTKIRRTDLLTRLYSIMVSKRACVFLKWLKMVLILFQVRISFKGLDLAWKSGTSIKPKGQ
jgi:hypothetical protein